MKPATLSLSLESKKTIWLNLARLFQVTVICLTIGLFIASIPLNYEQRIIVCRVEPCPPSQLSTTSEKALSDIGMTVDSFVKTIIALDILIAIAYTASAIVIFLRKPNDMFTIFVTIMLVTFGAATFTGGIQGISRANPQLFPLTTTIEMIGNCAITAFLFIFPTGRFQPRWILILFIGWILFQVPHLYYAGSALDLSSSSPIFYNAVFAFGILSGVASQIYRYRRVSGLVEKQQTKWVVYGLAIGVGGYIIVRLLSVLIPDPSGSGLGLTLALSVIAIVLMLLVPISIAIAVLRYRLWDINPIINRTLVYGALSALTIAFYIFAVGFFSNLFQHSSANFIISFIATGAVATLFDPLRRGLQRGVNRLMYGERDDPATVLTRLSQRLESALAPDSVLQTIVETLVQTLRIPYAAITLFYLDEEPRLISRFGLPPSEVIGFPLTYQTERVGELILAPRAEGESFSTEDIRLINLLAQQAGVSAHTVHLNNALQHSREKLVTAQEEERRRLRRDLHDGVGPTLASLSQRLDTASDLVKSDPEKSIQLLKDLKGQVKSTVAEIRRLVYALRPPVLDEFGLISAIREHIAPYSGPGGLRVEIRAPHSLPLLSAAVEVAAYRIILEAFTNVVNHAQADKCYIDIETEGNSLMVEVADDGKGISENARSGVGLSSMRERAAELGGTFIVETISPHGTRIKARLPIPKE